MPRPPKHRRRIRRRAWTLTITSALLAVVWVGSMKMTLSVTVPPRTTLYCSDGRFTFARFENQDRSESVEASLWNRDRWRAEWWISIGQGQGANGAPWLTFWRIPLWPFILLTGVPGVWMLAKSRRGKVSGGGAGANLCPSCGYDLTGLPTTKSGPCPECGKTAEP